MNKKLQKLAFLFSAMCLSVQSMASLSPGLTVTITPSGYSNLFNHRSEGDSVPTFSANTYVTFQLSKPLSRFLFQWDNGANGAYDDSTYGNPPRGYEIDVSSDGNNWVNGPRVPSNTMSRRAHEITGNNIRWIRFRVLSSSATIHEIDIHDLSQCYPGPCDTWAFSGDSITEDLSRRNTASGSPFNVLVNRCDASRFPSMIGLGVGYTQTSLTETRRSLKDRLPQDIANNPGIYHWAILIGTNNAVNNTGQQTTFRNDLRDILRTVLNAGKQPILAHIPWNNGGGGGGESTQVLRNQIIDEVIAEFKASGGDPRYNLLKGPDFYTAFYRRDSANSSTPLLRDGIHTNAAGMAVMQELWADLACSIGLDGTPPPPPLPQPQLSGQSLTPTANGANFSVISNQSGTAWWYVFEGHAGSCSSTIIPPGSTLQGGDSMTAGSRFSSTLTGLNSGTPYTFCFAADSGDVSNLSDIWQFQFTTTGGGTTPPLSSAAANKQRLMNYLKDQYGKNIISGQMDVDWGIGADMVAEVFSNTGKYAAL
ncbi:MAG: SGNH/GDSL hydrolase family protein, partial [Clostridia bacterium]|nr:SGNH/GDSL hydrolase family protein [Clostridia bacterium]